MQLHNLSSILIKNMIVPTDINLDNYRIFHIPKILNISTSIIYK